MLFKKSLQIYKKFWNYRAIAPPFYIYIKENAAKVLQLVTSARWVALSLL